jgi:hypothetical protein
LSRFDFELDLVGQVRNQDTQTMEYDLPTVLQSLEFYSALGTTDSGILCMYCVSDRDFLREPHAICESTPLVAYKRRRRPSLTEKRDVSRWMGV